MVYGGSRYGCMGRLADSVVSSGGTLTSIVPQFFTGKRGRERGREGGPA